VVSFGSLLGGIGGAEVVRERLGLGALGVELPDEDLVVYSLRLLSLEVFVDRVRFDAERDGRTVTSSNLQCEAS